MTLVPLGSWRGSSLPRRERKRSSGTLARRNLNFPADRSIGDLFFQTSAGSFAFAPTREARGRVTVPPGLRVHLELFEDDPEALEYIGRLRRGDVQSIRLIAVGPALSSVIAICHLHDLERLSVTGDDLDARLIKLIIESFPKLIDLDLHDVRGWRAKPTFDERSLVGFSRLKRLRLLQISSADLGDGGVAIIGRSAPRLQALTIDSSRVTDAGLRPLRHLTRLKDLGVSDGVRGTGLQHVSRGLEVLTTQFYSRLNNDGLTCLANRFPELRSLNLRGAPVSNRGVVTLWQLTELQFVDLDKVRRLSDAGLVGIEHARRLTTLRLSGTRVSDDGMTRIGELRRLVELDLDYTSVTSIGISRLAPLTKLQRLDARGTQIDSRALDHIANLPRLESLNIGATAVDDGSIPALSRMSGLRDLWLLDARVSDEGARRLRKALPACEIHS